MGWIMTEPNTDDDVDEHMATVVLAVVDEHDNGRQILMEIGRVPIPPDRPPLTTDLIAVMQTTIDRVKKGLWTRDMFEKITSELSDLNDLDTE